MQHLLLQDKVAEELQCYTILICFLLFYISDAMRHILASDVTAGYPLPPFNASIKDGYAVISKSSYIYEICQSVDARVTEDLRSPSPGIFSYHIAICDL